MVILSINLAHPNIITQFKGIFKWQKWIFFKIAIFASNFSRFSTNLTYDLRKNYLLFFVKKAIIYIIDHLIYWALEPKLA